MFFFNRIFKQIIDFIYPPLCLKCWTVVREEAGFCAPCFKELRFIAHPFCDMCALPLDVASTDETRCAACLETPKLFQKSRAALVYNAESKPFILSFKNKGRTMYQAPLSKLMAQRGADVLIDADLVCAIPLHFWKRLMRGYNQADLLGEAVAGYHQKPFLPDLLKKKKMTKSQAGLSLKERTENVKAAFAVTQKYKGFVEGKVVVLIDDVMTSGATLTAATKELLKAKAKEVRVVVLARALLG